MITTNVLLQDAVTEAANGTTFDTGAADYLTQPATSLVFFISGTSATRTVNFEGKGIDGIYYPVACIDMSDGTLANTTSGNNEAWKIDLTGLDGFRARVSAVTGGTVSIAGRAILK